MSKEEEPVIKCLSMRKATPEEMKQIAEMRKAVIEDRKTNEKRHCKIHTAIFVNSDGKCFRAHKCQEKGLEGCKIGTIT